jgi:hypothetical protein
LDLSNLKGRWMMKEEAAITKLIKNRAINHIKLDTSLRKEGKM